MTNKKALLIIDMQKGSFIRETPRYDADGVIQRINHLAGEFRKSVFPVFVIQHDGTSINEYIPNTKDWEILDEIRIESSDIFIDKYANDAFYNTKLHSKLRKLGVNELFITGCATDFCVESTIQSALVRDYSICVVKDGHTTGNRPHLKAEQVIEHYNWIWQNMISTKGSIKVLPAEEIIALTFR